MARESDLFANFDRMRRQIDELFGDVFERTGFSPRRGFSPRVDVYHKRDPARAVVKVDLAGVAIEKVALEIRGRQLILAGERRVQAAEACSYQQLEIEHGPFRRVVDLGAEVVAEEARASYDDGMLAIEVPFATASKEPRQVPISAPGVESPSPGDEEETR